MRIHGGAVDKKLQLTSDIISYVITSDTEQPEGRILVPEKMVSLLIGHKG